MLLDILWQAREGEADPLEKPRKTERSFVSLQKVGHQDKQLATP